MKMLMISVEKYKIKRKINETKIHNSFVFLLNITYSYT